MKMKERKQKAITEGTFKGIRFEMQIEILFENLTEERIVLRTLSWKIKNKQRKNQKLKQSLM